MCSDVLRPVSGGIVFDEFSQMRGGRREAAAVGTYKWILAKNIMVIIKKEEAEEGICSGGGEKN